MAGSSIVLTHVMEWSVENAPFSLSISDRGAVLTTPDGQTLELTWEEWSALATAIARGSSWSTEARHEMTRPSRAGTPWTEALDRRLVERWRDKIPMRDLAREFGRTEGAISSRLARLGQLIPKRDEA